jgi:hypothetical protein
MKKLRALQNPFVLVGQGFVAGAILFLSTTPSASQVVLHHAPHFVLAAARG